jgi:energy-coupling factor transporter transmembrane protein EcfT
MKSRRPVQIDPRIGVAVFAVVVATALFVVSSTAAMAALLAYVGLLYAAVGLGIRSLGRHLARLWWVAAVIVLLNGVLVPGDPLVSVGGRTVMSRAGVSAGVFFSLRLLVLYFATVLLLAVTPPVEFAKGAHAALRPLSARLANQVAFYGFLVLSFLPLFADEFDRIRLAQSFRGADFKGGLLRRADAARALIVPLVLSAIHRSAQLAAVVELRGLRDRVGASVPPGRPSWRDIIFAAVTVGVLAAVALILDTAVA